MTEHRGLDELASKASSLPAAEGDALVACLADAPASASREQVLAETFARLGYLPAEAERLAAKLLG